MFEKITYGIVFFVHFTQFLSLIYLYFVFYVFTRVHEAIFFNFTFIVGEIHGISYYIYNSGSLLSYFCKIFKYMIVESFLERPSKDFGSVSNFLTV